MANAFYLEMSVSILYHFLMKYLKLFAIFLISLLTVGCFSHVDRKAELKKLKSDKREVAFDIVYTITSHKVKRFKLISVIPRDWDRRQKVLSIDYSIPPKRVFEDGGVRYAEFKVKKPKRKTKIIISVRMEIYRYDLKKAMENPYPVDIYGKENFLQQEKHIESEHPEIVKVAKSLKGKDKETTIENVREYIIKTLRPSGYNPKSIGAYTALETSHGDCTEYAKLFVALCRASGMSSISAYGLFISNNRFYKHEWAEVWSNKYGWIPFDLHYSDTHGTESSISTNQKILFSLQTNDDNLERYYFYYFKYWGNKSSIHAKYEISNL